MPALLRILAEQPGKRPPERRHEFILYVLMYHNIIRGNACLSGIEALAPRDALRSDLYISIFVNDTRAFAPEFKHDRCKIPGCSGHHDASECRAPCKENHIPSFC